MGVADNAGPGLRQVAVADLRLGMHVHKLDGGWWQHPFWKSNNFKLDDPAQLAELKASGIRTCWVDPSRSDFGRLPDAPVVAPAAPSAPVEAPFARSAGEAAAPPAAARSEFAEEIERAAEVCRSGRRAVKSMFAEARLGKALDAEKCLPLVEEITGSVLRNPGALVSLARLKTADDYSYMHSVAVCALMVALGRQLGLDDPTCRVAGMAGLLHDMGKAVMPTEVLNKPGKLTDAEFATMRTHPLRGHELLAESRGAPAEALDVCLHHHERPDGTGYPHGLVDDERLSLLARMGAVCDVYDAITSNRPYKAGWDPAESIARMGSWKGQFDPAVLAAFIRSLGIYPTGSLVRLASDRLAVVLEQNPQALVSPRVRVFFSTRSQMPVPVSDLDLADPACNDRIVGRELPSTWGFTHTEEIWAGADSIRRSRG